MSDNKLVLHPIDPNAVFEGNITLINKLKEIRFLGKEFDWFKYNHYKAGELFFEFIDFHKSHTVMVIDSPTVTPETAKKVDSRSTCHISISEPFLEPQYLGGLYTPSPLCSNCGYKHNNAIEFIDTWFEKDKFASTRICPNCKKSYFINELDWENCVGFGKQEISIWNIHADEAVPSDNLLTLLQNVTGTNWTYFYYHL